MRAVHDRQRRAGVDEDEVAGADVADDAGVDLLDAGGGADGRGDRRGTARPRPGCPSSEQVMQTGPSHAISSLEQPGMLEADVGQLPQQVVHEDEAAVVAVRGPRRRRARARGRRRRPAGGRRADPDGRGAPRRGPPQHRDDAVVAGGRPDDHDDTSPARTRSAGCSARPPRRRSTATAGSARLPMITGWTNSTATCCACSARVGSPAPQRRSGGEPAGQRRATLRRDRRQAARASRRSAGCCVIPLLVPVGGGRSGAYLLDSVRNRRYQRARAQNGVSAWSKSWPASTSASSSRRPPRHFLYPALLLLLAEEPRHGYRLVDALLRLGFGPFDRPSVYRALAELEGDGLLRSWSASPTAGSTRHVYAVTDEGFAALAEWMAVVEDEQSLLSAVLKRYDVVLGWAADDTLDAREPDERLVCRRELLLVLRPATSGWSWSSVSQFEGAVQEEHPVGRHEVAGDLVELQIRQLDAERAGVLLRARRS